MNFFLDCEFYENGKTIELISIGIVDENDRGFYAETLNAEDLASSSQWLERNVLPSLSGPRVARHAIAQGVLEFCDQKNLGSPVFWGYYCVSPETRVLTTDLRWVPAGDVRVGDSLAAFEESTTPGRGRSSRPRSWSGAVVERAEMAELPCYDLTFDDGTRVRCSSDHRWLASGDEAARWVTTESLRCNGQGWGSNIVKPVDVWSLNESRMAGYLAAAFDGEGNLRQLRPWARASIDHSGFNVTFAQKSNLMLAEVKRGLTELGYGFSDGQHPTSGVQRVRIGNRRDILHFLGSVRPTRLLGGFDPGRIGVMPLRTVKLVKKESVGVQPVAAISTSTGTYIAEGLASHNCDYDWVVFCQLFGAMIDLPRGFPMLCFDLKQWAFHLDVTSFPLQKDEEHNALNDARWNKLLWETLKAHARTG